MRILVLVMQHHSAEANSREAMCGRAFGYTAGRDILIHRLMASCESQTYMPV